MSIAVLVITKKEADANQRRVRSVDRVNEVVVLDSNCARGILATSRARYSSILIDLAETYEQFLCAEYVSPSATRLFPGY